MSGDAPFLGGRSEDPPRWPVDVDRRLSSFAAGRPLGLSDLGPYASASVWTAGSIRSTLRSSYACAPWRLHPCPNAGRPSSMKNRATSPNSSNNFYDPNKVMERSIFPWIGLHSKSCTRSSTRGTNPADMNAVDNVAMPSCRCGVVPVRRRVLACPVMKGPPARNRPRRWGLDADRPRRSRPDRTQTRRTSEIQSRTS